MHGLSGGRARARVEVSVMHEAFVAVAPAHNVRFSELWKLPRAVRTRVMP